MKLGKLGPWVIMLVVSVAVGVAIAGRPSGSDEEQIRSVSSSTVATTVLGESAGALATSTTTPSAPPFPGTIALGETGDAVRVWQQQMKDRGWAIEVDGEFGKGASAICRRFQQQKHLEVNGTVDEATWDATWSAAQPDTVT